MRSSGWVNNCREGHNALGACSRDSPWGLQASEQARKVKGAESWIRDREIAFSGPIQRLNYLTFSWREALNLVGGVLIWEFKFRMLALTKCSVRFAQTFQILAMFPNCQKWRFFNCFVYNMFEITFAYLAWNNLLIPWGL